MRALVLLGLLGACGGEDPLADGDADEDSWTAATDCDDTDPDVYPGAQDLWYDGFDSNCDGESDYDADLDGWDAEPWGGADCDDEEPLVNPDAVEVYCNERDDDCAADTPDHAPAPGGCQFSCIWPDDGDVISGGHVQFRWQPSFDIGWIVVDGTTLNAGSSMNVKFEPGTYTWSLYGQVDIDGEDCTLEMPPRHVVITE